MKLKIKSTVVPLEYIDKFPCNDLHTIKGADCKLLGYNGKILNNNNNHEKFSDTFGPNNDNHYLCGSGLVVLG